ncbi:transposase InsO family protein [Paenibacillus sp. JGP012]|uniref:Mu transposase C-terminal domain-containing protein n=1 Tax=Paenibacillus sp. JGP012 TaxID=2735914 RepID=UPI00160E231A|nr:Mu transposase C-terminal domain-containing protein [Paenibacillus sp. JGP012]MBB6023589.1 transposase InsO family protein [Paenibacillus sp. JGP012]
MRRSALRINDEFELNGRRYVVLELNFPNVIIQPLTGELSAEEVSYYYLTQDSGFKLLKKQAAVQATNREFISKAQLNGFIDSLSEKNREKITRKFEMIQPILLLERVKTGDQRAVIRFQDKYGAEYLDGREIEVKSMTQKQLIQRIASKFDVSTRTIERDLKKYRSEEQFSEWGLHGLVSEKLKHPYNRKDMRSIEICHPRKKEWILCTIRTYLEEGYVSILKEAIEQHYLNKKQPSILEVKDIIDIRCEKTGLPQLGYNTIYAILNRLDEEMVLRMRNGTVASEVYDRVTGQFSNTEAKSSLHMVQIDHTEMDIMVVDETTMEVIGRPWLTLGIDVYSRCIWCMHISFDSPSANKVRKAIEHGIFKKRIKEKYGTIHEWEVFGIPDIIYFDNGKEFDNREIKYLIDNTLESQVMYRPVATPRWGGTIERLFGTVNTKLIHRLAGTTKNSIEAKGDYDSEGEAIYTLEDVTELLTRFITDIYHHDIHSSLPFDSATPHLQYQKGLNIGGQNDYIDDEDEEAFHIALLPTKDLTFSRLGVRLDNVYYNAIEPGKEIKINRSKYKVKYDIDDISHIYVLDHLSNEYIKVLAVNPPYEVLKGMKKKTYKLLLKISREKAKSTGAIPNESDLLHSKDILMNRILDMKKTNKGRRKVINLGLEQFNKNSKPGKRDFSNGDDELLRLVEDLNHQLEQR